MAINVLYDIKPINFGYTRTVGQLCIPREKSHRSAELTIFEGAVSEDGAHSPACAITIHGEERIKALRDVLVEAFPLSGGAA